MRHPFVRAAAALLLSAAACAMLGASPRPLRDGEAGPAVTAENTSVSTYPAESGVTESVGSGTDSSTAETMPADLPANLDSLCIGRLSIPDCGIDVSLYDASDLTDEERQAVTDLDGAAVWIDESDASECKQPLGNGCDKSVRSHPDPEGRYGQHISGRAQHGGAESGLPSGRQQRQ